MVEPTDTDIDVADEISAADPPQGLDLDEMEDGKTAPGTDALPFDEHEARELAPQQPGPPEKEDNSRTAADLEAVFDVPVRVSAVLGHSRMKVSDLLKLTTGRIVELDRKVGEAIDIYVNDRLVARGEVVLVDSKLGVTMTEIIKSEK